MTEVDEIVYFLYAILFQNIQHIRNTYDNYNFVIDIIAVVIDIKTTKELQTRSGP